FSRGWHSSRFNSVAVSRIKRNFRRFSLASFAICHVAQYAGHKQVNTPLFDSWTCKIFRRILATQLQADRNFMSGGSVFRFARRRCVESSPSLVTLMVSAVLLLVLHQNEPALAADGCPTPGFTAARTFQAGSYPFFVAVGEVNSDGKLDVVTANAYSDNVSVLLGRGDGTFQTAVNYNSGRYPQFVAIGDFNGDGKSDLAVANTGSYPNFTDGSVSILLGNGDGTFQKAVNYDAGPYPASVAVGDFNGDGNPDLAVANVVWYDQSTGTSTNGGVSLLFGKGDGTFKATVKLGAGRAPHSVAVNDFNGDGKEDIAVANVNSGDVSVLLGNGDGTFQTAVNYALGNYPYAVAVGDFNGDAKPDLAVATGGGVLVLLNNDDGTFRSPMSY